ncbi:hypothetical protein [Pontibacillus salipaludis]|uniref:Lipoprotein n=1 Tax=Pontibacillus salipaludis TaxID=1697394 RepID=A0ABQ1Q6M1_9BACI|nr:hypothetical protein [Pontibacillus salipaludis]GGD13571.1 hypothetical protein GCM10011389_21500 [Pontibacillus salipaludis]
MKKLFILFIVIGFVLVGCKNEDESGKTNEPSKSDSEINHVDSSKNADVEPYNGQTLKVAVVGTSPKVREDNVRFNEISFKKLRNGELSTYDAVFVMKENLAEASQSQYVNVYKKHEIPFFFIAAKNSIPFILKSEEYSEFWKWTSGTMYTSGVIYKPKEYGSFKHMGVYLRDGEKTEQNLYSMYSSVFKMIEETNL